nr:hypothetical protein [Tanacetum cinerariifolium]
MDMRLRGSFKDYKDSCEKSRVQVFYKEILNQYHQVSSSFVSNNKCLKSPFRIDKFRILEEMMGISLDIQNAGVQSGGNQNGLVVVPEIANQNGTGNVVATQLLIAQKEKAGIQLQAEEFDFMAAVGDLDEIEEVNTN